MLMVHGWPECFPRKEDGKSPDFKAFIQSDRAFMAAVVAELQKTDEGYIKFQEIKAYAKEQAEQEEADRAELERFRAEKEALIFSNRQKLQGLQQQLTDAREQHDKEMGVMIDNFLTDSSKKEPKKSCCTIM
jgi:hypothetical protein